MVAGSGIGVPSVARPTIAPAIESPPFPRKNRPRPSGRRRPRRGTLEQPVNGRAYRSAWLFVAFPLLIAAFSVVRPAPLAAPDLQASFDGLSTVGLAQELARLYPDRSPGTPGSLGAARWVADRFRAYGLKHIEVDAFSATIPGRGRVLLRNLVARAPGRTGDAIVVMAHRDDTGSGPGANDNASGTAALIELARVYALARADHPIVFLSSDGGAFGALGARRFAEDPAARNVVAVVNLDSIAGRGPPRIELTGDEPRSPSPALVETAATRILEQTDTQAGRTSLLGQLTDLGFPFSFYEQAPLVGRGIPAITLTTAGNRPPPAFGDAPDRLDGRNLTRLGRAAQQLVGSLDKQLELARGTGSYLYVGQRFVRGWAIELCLIAALVPFLIGTVDLFALCRRRRVPIGPALRSYRSRLGFWLWAWLMFEFLALVGIWPGGASRPINPETGAAGDWPLLGLLLLAVLVLPGWIVSRSRIVPRRAPTAEEELAAHTATMLALGVVALLVVATNPFALLFVLPSLHAWLWLPNVRGARPAVRAAVLAAGWLGPLILLGSFAFRFGLGFDAPWYLAELFAIDYVPIVASLLVLCWLAGAAQLLALTLGRYAPYPAASERPPRGPLRNAIRALVLGVRARRRVTELERRALEG
jgi:hypothetical protein